MYINAILDHEFISKYPVKSYKIALFVIKCWKEWDDLDNTVIINCAKSMLRRIKACIDANGGHTKY
ncbi:hypothetical protein RhiirB3_445494 [Rhizophagus irregularis]|nr:hypothetical protein RhiirB3_431243 [Rhizophagus irregularis]PKY22239.1 hypothetical protein RhiirB3_436108 [Rhizophagus irregularis]PKY29039.1 hypothetical protein RhiirB3_445494 [Rhizophagus irregularis]